jgi:PhoH-like ATPase
MYTGVKVIDVSSDIISSIYLNKEISLDNLPINDYFENEYLVIKDNSGGSASAICRVNNGKCHVINTKILEQGKVGLKPRNKEQEMTMDALLDEEIKVVALTGSAGTGKTIVSLAVAMHLVDKGLYERIILTRPMSQVGVERTMGFLPGDVDEKFLPFLSNYFDNMEFLVGNKKKRGVDRTFNQDLIMQQYNIECIPLALIRGASWMNSIILADEVQSLTKAEMLTLGTRVANNSKLVLMGDLKQIDGHMRDTESGLWKFINSKQAKNSSLVASIHLIKSERGPIPALFANIFEE